jgi:hypothetical protein
MSDYEKYIISLPDRTNLSWDPFGEVDEDYLWSSHDDAIDECLTVALIPGCTKKEALSKEFRENFIQDKSRLIPNDQELTAWVREKISGYDEKIQYCKIFVNPEAGEFPIDQDIIDEECAPRYKIVIHYSVPKGDWEEVDVPDMGSISDTYMQNKIERVYSRSSHEKRKVLTKQ